MSSHHTTQTDLQQALGCEFLTLLAGPRHGVDHVADVVGAGQGVVQFRQVLGGLGLAADLEELDADLPRLGAQGVEFLGRADDDALDVVAGHAVGDDYDVEWFDRCRLAVGLTLDGLCDFREVWSEDMGESRAGRGAAERTDGLEEILDGRSGGDVGVAAVGGVRVAMVQEVDVNAIRVIGSTDGCNGREGCRGFPPAPPRHTSTVVDEEDGVEFP